MCCKVVIPDHLTIKQGPEKKGKECAYLNSEPKYN